MTFLNNEPFRPVELLDPKIGDVIEFNLGHYSHFGIYVGDRHIVHTGKDENSPWLEGKALIVKEHIRKAADLSFVRINNKLSSSRIKGVTVRSPERVVAFAMKQVGSYFDYNLIKNNCECFVTCCKFQCNKCYNFEVCSHGWSDQKDHFLQTGARATEFAARNGNDVIQSSQPNILHLLSAIFHW